MSPFEDLSLTPLAAVIAIQRLQSFCRVALRVVDSRDENDSSLVSNLIDTRVIAELDQLASNPSTPAIRLQFSKFVLQALTIETSSSLMRWAATMLSHWYHDSQDWRKAVEGALNELVKLPISMSKFLLLRVAVDYIGGLATDYAAVCGYTSEFDRRYSQSYPHSCIAALK